MTSTASTFFNTAAGAGFNYTDYLPAGTTSDVATLEGYYNQFQNATQGLSVAPGGRLELSDTESQAALGGIIASMTALGPEGAALGGLTAALLAVLPKAGAGPGVCANSPPPGPLLSQLQSWPYFGSWESRNGSYPAAVPGTFEAFANPVLEYNWLLWNNCYDFQTPPPVLLATLIAAWNAKHSDLAQRTITRSGLNSSGFGTPPGWDPIADALQQAYLAQYTPSNPTFDQVASGSGAPNDVSSSFTINDGPLLVHMIPLTLHPPPISMAIGNNATTTAAKKVAGVTVAAAGSLTLAAIVISLVKGKAWDWAFGQAWAEIKDVFAAGGPHKFLGERNSSARERNPIAESKSATQTLLFSRRKYTPTSAKAWARAHGYHSGKVDVTSNYIRLRQQSPSKFRRLRTVTFSKDIKAVIGFN